MFPPENDDEDWWEGTFTHFNFDSLFSEIVKRAPMTMADPEFQENKWRLKGGGIQDMLEPWNEYSSIAKPFFGSDFVEFLEQDGKC
jgi:hypothetical protein